MADPFTQLQQQMQTWTLFHWAGISFGAGFAVVMAKAVVDEVRDAKGVAGKIFIVFMAIGAALIGLALLIEANKMWKIFG